jgi:hypothetical protein
VGQATCLVVRIGMKYQDGRSNLLEAKVVSSNPPKEFDMSPIETNRSWTAPIVEALERSRRTAALWKVVPRG